MTEHLYAHILLLVKREHVDRSLALRLEELGHRVHLCRKTAEALESLLELDIDLLLLDPGPEPDEDSMQVVERLHEREPTRCVPVAVLLPARERWIGTAAWRAGADDVIDPEVRSDELDARVQRLVRTGRRQREVTGRFDRLLSVTDTLDDALIVMDGSGMVQAANQAAHRMLHLDPDILRERPLTRILSVIGVSRESIERVLTTDSSVDEELAAMVDGQERVLELSCTRLPIAGDGRPALGAVFRDVTERRDQDRQQADFHSMIAHDLRNPISVIQGYLQLLGGGDAGVPLEEIVQRISEKVEDVSRLLDDFLDFSMLDAGFLRLEPAPLELRKLLEEMAGDVEILAAGSGVQVRLEIDPQAEELELEGDAHRLRQVLQNLLTNAFKYGGDGGEVEVLASVSSRGVRISVTDQGPGIAPDEQDAIFERYQRARRDHGDGRGIGLGLMIVRRIVEAHGGRVGLDSALGQGSTFWFEIPPAHVRAGVARVIPTY